MAKAKSKTENKKKHSKLAKILIFLLICIMTPIICLLAFFGYMNFELTKKSPIDHTVVFEINRGDSIKTVGMKLEKSQQIPSGWFFKVFLKSVKFSSLQAGEFAFPPYSNTKEIVHILRYSKPMLHHFTVIEGSTTSMVLDTMRNTPYLSGNTPDSWDEGYLFANTWAILKGTTRISLLKRMRKSLENVLNQEWNNRADNIAVKTKEQALILASIIEKETAIKSERFNVSAVYSNRLRLNMRLQADPTTIYGITQGRYKLNRSLNRKDLAKQNEYNTYMMLGLPKTPISIVSRASINAALHPAKVNYLYFVATGHGGSKFARNYKDHQRNIRKWLKVLKQRKAKTK